MNDIRATHSSETLQLSQMMEQLLTLNIGMSKHITNIDNQMANIDERVTNLENNAEVTTTQATYIRNAVHRHVCELLGVHINRSERDEAENLIMAKYSDLFHKRCYTEVARHGNHLGRPYSSTRKADYVNAIKDIEAWVPSNTINGLKKEADENARINLQARKEGYR